jgi:cystathionine beta-lyase/cystathionine gamma-synthase
VLNPPELGDSVPLVPPLYQSSVYTLPDLDALDRIANRERSGYIYARDAHPNADRLAAHLAKLEGATWAMACGSGMAAISAALLSQLDRDDRIVASTRLYGRTRQLLDRELTRFGIRCDFVDVCDLDQLRDALKTPARLVFVETMSNPLLRVVDLDELGKICTAKKCGLVVDNTFATPIGCRPLERGATMVVESLTKMIGGHADVTLGMACGRGDWLELVAATVSIWGLAAPPFDCWLAERGLATLPLRVKAACANAQALADWLVGQRGVRRVVYPGRSDHPDHELAKRILDVGFGNMLCFELEGGRDAANRFFRLARGIPFSPSLGNVTTTVSHPSATSHRHDSPAEKKRQGITDGLIRVSVGCEELAAIQDEFTRGL